MSSGGIFSFPDPVNELAARTVAAGVAALAIATILTREGWLLVPLVYGFWARVLTGPTLSPLGQLATRVVAPRLGRPRSVPGPPKRFAQAMGAGMSTLALLLWYPLDQRLLALVVLGLLVCAAVLEAAFAICLGCRIFAVLIRRGVIPVTVCDRCNDISAPRGAARAKAPQA